MNTRIRERVARLAAYIPGEQPSDPSVIKLNTNENPYPPSPKVFEAIQRVTADMLRLYPDPVCRRLRESIAQFHGCDPEQVFCGNGSDEILALCIRAYVERHGKIGYFDPSYSLYPVLADVADVGVAPIPLEPDFTCPIPPNRYDVPLFFWTNPNAPTSLLAPKEMIRDYAERSEGVVVVDEAYVDFASQDCVELALSLPNVLITRTLSKSYSLAGIRLGYAIGDRELIAALFKIKDAYNVNLLTQEIARAAIADQPHMQENARRIIATRDRVVRDLRARGVEVYDSQANFVWARPARGTAHELFELLRARNILVRYFTAPRTANHLRITVGTDGQMDALLAAWE